LKIKNGILIIKTKYLYLINKVPNLEYSILGDKMEMFNINADDSIEEVKYFEYYTLKQNMTLFELAKNKNVNPKLLAVLNGLETDDFLLKNQLIMIPKNNYSYYITKEGDTLTTVAKTFNTSTNNLMKNNKTIYLTEGQLVVNKI